MRIALGLFIALQVSMSAAKAQEQAATAAATAASAEAQRVAEAHGGRVTAVNGTTGWTQVELQIPWAPG